MNRTIRKIKALMKTLPNQILMEEGWIIAKSDTMEVKGFDKNGKNRITITADVFVNEIKSIQL